MAVENLKEFIIIYEKNKQKTKQQLTLKTLLGSCLNLQVKSRYSTFFSKVGRYEYADRASGSLRIKEAIL